jgi:hypothetical protein
VLFLLIMYIISAISYVQYLTAWCFCLVFMTVCSDSYVSVIVQFTYIWNGFSRSIYAVS